MNYKLHYAEKSNNFDIPCYDFKSFEKIINFIHEHCFDECSYPYDNVVYLFTYESEKYINSPILIESVIGTILDHLESMKINEIEDEKQSNIYKVFFLQEYFSYEEAYKVALGMREVSNLCYEKDLSKLTS